MRLLVLALLAITHLGSALTYKGADFSSLVVVEKAGRSFTDGGTKKGLETILAAHGANTARIRVWTAGDYTVDYGIALAKRAKAAGMKIMVDLHFSDTCELAILVNTLIGKWLTTCRTGADPAHQSIPSSWGGSGATLDQLNKAIYEYVRLLARPRID